MAGWGVSEAHVPASLFAPNGPRGSGDRPRGGGWLWIVFWRHVVAERAFRWWHLVCFVVGRVVRDVGCLQRRRRTCG